MKKRHHIAVVVALALSAVAVGGAIAATKLTPKQESQAVINDAAEQLGVEPNELTDALKQALKNRVDAAVTDGRLTREQAQRMKERIDAGGMPLFGLGPGRFGHHDGPHPFHAKFDAAARYLGLTRGQLREALRGGKTLAQIARDRDKSVEGLVDALLADAREKLGADVPADLRQRIEDLVNGRAPRFRPPHRRGARGDAFRVDVF